MKITGIVADARRRIEEDRVAARVVRWGLLIILFLLLTLLAFYALDRWFVPEMPAGEEATAAQKAVYPLLSAALLAVLTTTVVAAWRPLKDATPLRRTVGFAPLMAGALALLIFCLGYVFLGVYPLGGKSILMVDLHHQYAPLLSELRHMVLQGGDLQYNFHIGMGAGFIPTFAYYLASPLNLLLVFFEESSLTEAILLITLVKFTAAAAAFTALAQYLTRRRTASMVMVGVMYALSGYMLAYSWNIMWLDVVALLPLVVLALEHMLKTGKIYPYALVLALTLFCNYYLGFMVCIFLVLYWLVWWLRKRRTVKEFFVGGLRFAAGSLWGAGMVAALLIPTALALGRTSAAGGEVGDFRTNFEIFDLFGRMFYGASPTIRSGNLPNLYCGVAAVVLLPLYFGQKEIHLRRRLCYGGLLAVLLLSCTLTRWDLVWHGLHAPNDLPYRFSFLTVFVTLLLAAYTLTQLKHVTRRQLGVSLLASAAYLVLWEKLGGSVGDGKALYINLTLLAVYGLVLLAGVVRRAPRQAVARLLLTVVCAELLFGTARTLTAMNANEYYTGRAHYIDNTNHLVINDALRRVEELAAEEDAFLRMEYLPRTSCLDTALHHYSGLTTFASSNPYCTTVLMGELGYAVNGVNSYLYHSYVAPPDSLLGLRYVLLQVFLPEHPQLEYIETLTATDEESGDEVSYYIYRNKTALPIGFAATSALPDYEGEPYDPFGCQQRLYTALSGLEDALYEPMVIYAETSGATIYDSSFYMPSGGATYSATVETAGQYFAYVDCRAADTITVNTYDASGNTQNTWSVTNYEPYIIDMGTLTPNQVAEVYLSGDGAATGNIYLMRFDTAAFDRHCQVLTAGGLTVTQQTGHSIKGTLTAQEDGTLFFSLPYDKGWQVYVDGKAVDTFPIDRGEDRVEKEDGTFEYVKNDDGALLGAYITQGEHTVEIVYTAPGLTTGLLISGGSIALLLIPLLLWIFRRRRGEDTPTPPAAPLPSETPAAQEAEEQPTGELVDAPVATEDLPPL